MLSKEVRDTVNELKEVSHAKQGEVEQEMEETINERTEKESEEQQRAENQGHQFSSKKVCLSLI